ncbi:MAG: hypothetical protein ABIH46_11315 [Chloroflexota bacterium]
MTTCISADELLRLARVAAKACGWPESTVRLVANDWNELPAISIHNQRCWALEDSKGVFWAVGDDEYENVTEALAQACANFAFDAADRALAGESVETVAT